MADGKSVKYVTTFLLLLFLNVQIGSAFWPFSSADPEEFKHDSVIALTKDNFEEHVRPPWHQFLCPKELFTLQMATLQDTGLLAVGDQRR